MTKAQIKFIQSLTRQKYRKEYNAYLVEGEKNAKEWLLSEGHILQIAATAAWLTENGSIIRRHPEAEIIEAQPFELEKVTALQTAQTVVLVVQMPAAFAFQQPVGQWALYLEKIQDPGNMGTIIRTADWFGIHHIICSPDCVEVYNPKVVQASMGSLLRVNISEMDVPSFLSKNQGPVYAAVLEGQDIRQLQQPEYGTIAMGNESRGLSPELIAAATHKLMIPGMGGAESLNVAVAAGILCAKLTGSI
jgi:RNA methyltransferase, TrmH family